MGKNSQKITHGCLLNQFLECVHIRHMTNFHFCFYSRLIFLYIHFHRQALDGLQSFLILLIFLRPAVKKPIAHSLMPTHEFVHENFFIFILYIQTAHPPHQLFFNLMHTMCVCFRGMLIRAVAKSYTDFAVVKLPQSNVIAVCNSQVHVDFVMTSCCAEDVHAVCD